MLRYSKHEREGLYAMHLRYSLDHKSLSVKTYEVLKTL